MRIIWEIEVIGIYIFMSSIVSWRNSVLREVGDLIVGILLIICFVVFNIWTERLIRNVLCLFNILYIVFMINN